MSITINLKNVSAKFPTPAPLLLPPLFHFVFSKMKARRTLVLQCSWKPLIFEIVTQLLNDNDKVGHGKG